MVRLIASDLDGTIVRRDGSISKRTIEAFTRARNEGVQIVFVTGRPTRWLQPIRDAFGSLGSVICSNGAVVYDFETDKILESHTIPADDVMQTREIILEVEPQSTFAAETLLQLHLEETFPEPGDMRHLLEFRPAPLDALQLGEEGVVKFLAKSRLLTPENLHELVEPKVQQYVSVTHSAFNMTLLEMAHPSVNKAAALARHAELLGIPSSEVVAFGDMPNDIQMLGWAGRGYAMAGGHPTAIAACEYEADTVENDGVARVIEDLLRS